MSTTPEPGGAELGGKREPVRLAEHLGSSVDHDYLMSIVIRLPGDYQPYGYRRRDVPEGAWLADCSAGCRWYVPLQGDLQYDWGICANARSHRCGLLTFEHQGCPVFEAGTGESG